jgi:hypothetical protein
MTPYWDATRHRVCDNCGGAWQRAAREAGSGLDLVDMCKVCDYDVCNTCRQQVADSLFQETRGHDDERGIGLGPPCGGRYCGAARHHVTGGYTGGCYPDCPLVCMWQASCFSPSGTWWLREGHSATIVCADRRKSRGADRNLGYLPLPDRNLGWIRKNLFRHTNGRGLGGLSMDTVLSDEDDDGCYGSDAYDDPEGSDWSDCELSDELGPAPRIKWRYG